MIYHFDKTASTNDDARDAKYRDGDIVWADFQTAGRGQRGHTWQSRAGENLTFSVVLEPTFLPVTEQFMLLEAVALALTDFFASLGVKTAVKWTNDIYVGDKKAVGILIEHSYAGGKLARTIVGIGININQTDFPSDIPNPVSLALLTGKRYELEALLRDFEQSLAHRYEQLRRGEWDALQSDYHSALYRRDERHIYALPNGEKFGGIIRGVKPQGELVVELDDGRVTSFLFKEIEFII